MHISPFLEHAAQSFVYLINHSLSLYDWFVRHIEEETYQKQEAWELELSFYGFSLRLS